jgi:hypothetical protein
LLPRFARKAACWRRPIDPVLQQARAADNERLVADVVQRHGEAFHDLLGQLRVLERPTMGGFFGPARPRAFAVADVLQVAVVEEGQQSVRRDVNLERPIASAHSPSGARCDRRAGGPAFPPSLPREPPAGRCTMPQSRGRRVVLAVLYSGRR